LQSTKPDSFDLSAAFNVSLDEDYGPIQIATSTFEASRVLFVLDPTQYDAARLEWEADQTDPERAAA
jgi:hypothetical protein